MSKFISGVINTMLKKRDMRKTPFVDMDGYKCFYEGIGSKNV